MVERLERHGSGYVGKHEPDVFLTDDPWFRGIEISTGPDGSGFILDWSDTGECHDSTGVHRTSGRIFRISYGQVKKPKVPFAWRKPWPKADLKGDEHQRVLAIREMTQFWPLDLITGEPHPMAIHPFERMHDVEQFQQLLQIARSTPHGLVHLTLASTLQRLPLKHRPELAIELLKHAEYADDPFLPHMVWFGLSPLAKHDPAALVKIAQHCSWPKTLKWIARSLATQPEPLNALLTSAKPEQATSILEGMAEAFKGLRKVPKPESWDDFALLAKGQTNLIRDLSILFGDGRALDDVKKIVLDAQAETPTREAALKTLIEARPADLRAICESLLDVRGLNVTAVRGLTLFDDPTIGQRLAKDYRKFAPADRSTVLDALVSRPAWAAAMLESVGKGQIARAEVTAFHARQVRDFKDEALRKKLTEVWGELRESAADKKELIEKLKKQLDAPTLAKANLSQGRVLFTAICGACHQMYGEGGQIGPDLTGSGRSNLDYLLENIADPSGMVSADYRMSLLTLQDGRVLSGVITSTSDKTLTLRTLAETMTLEKTEITKTKTSPISMMPEGLLLAFQQDQIRDLIAYLMHPVQVGLPGASK